MLMAIIKINCIKNLYFNLKTEPSVFCTHSTLFSVTALLILFIYILISHNKSNYKI